MRTVLFFFFLTIKLSAQDTALGTFTDERDGQEYTFVKIGKQTWMAENLNYNVPDVFTNNKSIDTLYLSLPHQNYGRLYDWKTLVKDRWGSNENPSGLQGICPNGWHVPSSAEWEELELFLGMSKNSIQYLKSFRGTQEGTFLKSVKGWSTSNEVGVDSFQFNALPSGLFGRKNNLWGFSDTKTPSAYFWTSTKTEGVVVARYLNYKPYLAAGGWSPNKPTGMACRCIKN